MNNSMKRKAAVVASLALAGCMSVGGAFAYFSGTSETRENTVTLSEGQKDDDNGGTIDEPTWDDPTKDPDYTPDPNDPNGDPKDEVQPNDKLPKDPYITNNTDYSTYAMLRVAVPRVAATLDGKDGTYDVFDLEYEGGTLKDGQYTGAKYWADNLNKATEITGRPKDATSKTEYSQKGGYWTLVEYDQPGQNGNDTDKSVYYFVYTQKTADGKDQGLPSKARTLGPAFKHLVEKDFTKVTGVQGVQKTVDITGSLIQTTGYEAPTTKNATFNTLKAQADARAKKDTEAAAPAKKSLFGTDDKAADKAADASVAASTTAGTEAAKPAASDSVKE